MINSWNFDDHCYLVLVMRIKGSELCTKTDMSFSLENVSKNTHCLFCFHCVGWHLLTCWFPQGALWIETLQKRQKIQKIKKNWMSPNKDFFIDIESLLVIVFGMGIDFFHIFHIIADFWARSWVVSLKFCFFSKIT